jgi:hypothetical protein
VTTTDSYTTDAERCGSLRAGAQRQVVLVTDGLIGFEQEVVAEILAGDAASRVSPAAT